MLLRESMVALGSAWTRGGSLAWDPPVLPQRLEHYRTIARDRTGEWGEPAGRYPGEKIRGNTSTLCYENLFNLVFLLSVSLMPLGLLLNGAYAAQAPIGDV